MPVFPLLVALAGAGLLIGGVAWIYAPAALIIAGLLLLVVAFFVIEVPDA